MKQHTREEIDNMQVVRCPKCGHAILTNDIKDAQSSDKPDWLRSIIEYNLMAERIVGAIEISTKILDSTYVRLLKDMEDHPLDEESERTAICINLPDGRHAQVMMKITTDQSKWMPPYYQADV